MTKVAYEYYLMFEMFDKTYKLPIGYAEHLTNTKLLIEKLIELGYITKQPKTAKIKS